MRKVNFVVPILACSAIGTLGIMAMLSKLKCHKKSAPLDRAAAMIGEITEDAKERIDEIIGEIKSRMGAAEPDRTHDLNQLVSETKAKIDSAAAQIRSGLRKMKR